MKQFIELLYYEHNALQETLNNSDIRYMVDQDAIPRKM